MGTDYYIWTLCIYMGTDYYIGHNMYIWALAPLSSFQRCKHFTTIIYFFPTIIWALCIICTLHCIYGYIWVYGIWALTNCTPLPFPAWQTLYNNYILALWSHLLKVKVGKISQLVFVVKRLQNKQFCQIVHRTGHYWLKYFLKLCFTIHVTMLHVTCYTCAHRISTLAKSLGKNIH